MPTYQILIEQVRQSQIVTPDDFEIPPGGLNIRWPDPPLDQEMRLHRYAVKAAQAFARANRLDRVVIDSPNPGTLTSTVDRKSVV